MVGRLVEQEHVRLVQQNPGEHQSRLLTAAERAEARVVGELGDVEAVAYLVDAGRVRPPAELGIALLDDAQPVEDTIVRRVREGSGQLAQLPVERGQLTRRRVEELPYGQRRVWNLLGEMADPGAGRELDVALGRTQLAGEDREERRLAHAVRSDHADPVGRADGKGGVREQRLVVVGRAEVMNFPHKATPIRAPFRARSYQRSWTVGTGVTAWRRVCVGVGRPSSELLTCRLARSRQPLDGLPHPEREEQAGHDDLQHEEGDDV